MYQPLMKLTVFLLFDDVKSGLDIESFYNQCMKQDVVSSDQWHASLSLVLSPLLPLELLHETIDALVESIRHNDVQTTDTDQDLSLSELESHALTLLLAELLGPVLDEDTEWSFLASQVLEDLYAPPVAEAESRREKRPVTCELCERKMPLTVHHLIPRSTHAYFAQNGHLLDPPRNEKKSELALLQAMVCRPCHSMIHASVKSHKELAIHYASIDRLLEREDVQKWVAWVKTQRVSDAAMGRGIRYRK